VAVADMAVLLVTEVDTGEGLVVVEDTLVAVAQSVTAAPSRLVVLAHIASRNIPAVAEAVTVLRFPLCSLYTSIFNVFQVIFVAFQ
jgi:hypothetical protein